jgi:L-fuconolactonase
MPRIDSHQHFWKYDPGQYPWIQSDWPIRCDFLPEDLAPLLRAEGFDGCVAVQARQSLAETRWLLELARDNDFIAGVVGWVDLRSPELGEQIAAVRHPKLAGVRHVVQDEPDDQFMLQPEFLRGIEMLREFGLTYDILIFPKQLPAAIELVRRFPDQPFVLDHLAKPFIRDGVLEPWRGQMRELAQFPNVLCKLSGMVTEAAWGRWKPEDFRPYLETAWSAFGEDRLMIGSDWPVCLLSGDYPSTVRIVDAFLEEFPEEARAKVLGGNAVRFYKLTL